jgi:MFS family permease
VAARPNRERLLPALAGRIWVLVLANCLSNAGSGLTLPFLIVYLHDVRGIELGHAGLVLALIGAAGIATTPLAGTLADRIGARRTFVTGELVFAVATAGFVPATDLTQALVPAVAFGAAGGLTWSGLYAILGESVPPARRVDAFGISYALANLGIGLGALIGGLVVDVDSARSFVPLFAGDACSNLLFAAVLVRMGDAPAAGAPAAAGAETGAVRPGYRQVLGDRSLVGILLVNTLLVTVGTSQLTSGFPAWVTGPAHSTPGVVGAAFAANTITLAAAQLFVLRLIRRRRRTDSAAAGAFAFAVAWLVALGGGNAGAGTGAALALIGTLAVFGLGESLLAPTLPALVNDLAPAALRGRYNAVFTLSWQVGPVLGPAMAGFLLGRGLGDELLLLLAAGCLAAAAFARRLGRVVPESANLVGAAPPA